MNPGTLYHYCSFEDFSRIIREGKLRLYNVSETNDSSEINYLIDTYVSKLKSIGYIDFANFEENSFCEQRKYTFNLAASFFDSKDNAQLPGENGSFSVGFDKSKLEKWGNKIKGGNGRVFISNEDTGAFRQVCFFNTTEINEFVDSIIDNYMYEFKDALAIFSILLNERQFIKNGDRKRNREWVLSVMCDSRYSALSNISADTFGDTSFRVTEENNTKVCDISFDKSMITSITS